MTFSIVIMVGRGYFLPTHVHEASIITLLLSDRYNDSQPPGKRYLIFHDFTDFYDVGYEFKKKYQGCGYALEALGCTISAVNRMRGICRFTARTAEYNLPSIRLLERAGFIRTGERRQQLRCDEDGNPVSFTALVYVLALPEPDGGCFGSRQG